MRINYPFDSGTGHFEKKIIIFSQIISMSLNSQINKRKKGFFFLKLITNIPSIVYYKKPDTNIN